MTKRSFVFLMRAAFTLVAAVIVAAFAMSTIFSERAEASQLQWQWRLQTQLQPHWVSQMQTLFGVKSFAGFEEYSFDNQGNEVAKNSFLKQLQPGMVVVIGENHGFDPHHQNQHSVISEIIKAGYSVSVGTEHLFYTKQSLLDDYAKGKLDRASFLQQAGWREPPKKSCMEHTRSGNFFNFNIPMPFDCHEKNLLAAVKAGGQALALNMSRSITKKIFRDGVHTLTEKEKALLPPNFTLGRDAYYKRFKDTVNHGDHAGMSVQQIKRMFLAQSLWDDTMAWQAVSHLQKFPQRIVVIMVGDFHAVYGGGLKDRLLQRGASRVYVISQGLTDKTTFKEIKPMAAPHGRYGERADQTLMHVLR